MPWGAPEGGGDTVTTCCAHAQLGGSGDTVPVDVAVPERVPLGDAVLDVLTVPDAVGDMEEEGEGDAANTLAIATPFCRHEILSDIMRNSAIRLSTYRGVAVA
jgi:hypothetical protein